MYQPNKPLKSDPPQGGSAVERLCMNCGQFHHGECPPPVIIVCNCGNESHLPEDALFAITQLECGNCGNKTFRVNID